MLWTDHLAISKGTKSRECDAYVSFSSSQVLTDRSSEELKEEIFVVGQYDQDMDKHVWICCVMDKDLKDKKYSSIVVGRHSKIKILEMGKMLLLRAVKTRK